MAGAYQQFARPARQEQSEEERASQYIRVARRRVLHSSALIRDAACPPRFGGRVRLGFPRVMLARSAAHPEDDDRVGALDRLAGLGGAGLQTEEFRQREPGRSEHAGLQKTAAV